MKALAFALLGLLFLAPDAHAYEWLVNSTNDWGDIRPGDGECFTGTMIPDPANPTGRIAECSLRAAIQEANMRPYAANIVRVPAGTYLLRRFRYDADNEDRTKIIGTWDVHDSAETGDLDIQTRVDIIGDGEELTIIDAQDADRVIEIWSGAAVQLSHLTLRNGFSSNFGGGLRIESSARLTGLSNVTIEDCIAEGSIGGGIYNNSMLVGTRVTLRRNRAARGGGIENAHFLRLIESTITDNLAAAIFSVGGSGGGISNFRLGDDSPRVELFHSTVSGNRAQSGGGISNFGTVLLANVTIAQNVALAGAGLDFGLALSPVAQLAQGQAIYYTTIADNVAATDGGGFRRAPGTGETYLSHVILARNIGRFVFENCFGGLGGRSEYSIEDLNTCGLMAPTDQPSTPPLIDVLANNGGPTLTYRLLPDSPAIDAGFRTSNHYAESRDQRGVPRPIGIATDIGAYESGADPATLRLVIPFRFFTVFRLASPGVPIDFIVDIDLQAGVGSSKGGGADAAQIVAAKGGDVGGLKFELDKGGRKLRVSGVATGYKEDDVLFYVEVQRSMIGAAQLHLNVVHCDACGKPSNPPPIVIAPYKQ